MAHYLYVIETQEDVRASAYRTSVKNAFAAHPELPQYKMINCGWGMLAGVSPIEWSLVMFFAETSSGVNKADLDTAAQDIMQRIKNDFPDHPVFGVNWQIETLTNLP